MKIVRRSVLVTAGIDVVRDVPSAEEEQCELWIHLRDGGGFEVKKNRYGVNHEQVRLILKNMMEEITKEVNHD
jgi:hypothetical protein